MTVVLDHTFLGGVGGALNRICKEQWGTAQPRAPGMWDCCSDISDVSCCPAGPAAAAMWRYSNGMWPRYYRPAWTPGQSHYKFPTESPLLHLFPLLSEFSAGAGQAMGWVSVFYPEPMCTSWSRFPCQQDQSYLAQSSFSHGIWGVMAILSLLVTGLRLHISATRPKDSSGFGSILGLPEAFFSSNSNF